MRAAKWIAIWSVAWAFGESFAGAPPPMQIKFAEAVTLPAVAGKAEFDAYGRRFALTLEINDRLLRSIPAARKIGLGQARVLRGKLDGVPGSWVRLTRVGKGIEGAIWDGNDVYVVTSYGTIASKLTTPLVATPEQTVVYRLSDTLNGLPPAFCGLARDAAAVSKSGNSALQQYNTIVREVSATAATLNDELDISLIADSDFQNLMGPNAADAMLARLNVVDGIFAEQVKVLLVPTEFRLMPANADPFNQTDSSALLDQLATYRESTPEVRAAGLAHLMTGKNLDEDIIGIAFVDSLCDAHDGASLSDSEEGEFFSALVMAHEIGHNFGARHDGVEGVCASTPQTYLMSPILNGSAQFSSCSLNSMMASIAGARGVCIGAADYVDLALTLPSSPYSVQTNGAFSLPISVHSNGTQAARNVSLQVTFPPYFFMQSATLQGSICTIANSVITCSLADFAAGEDRALDLRITGNSVGTFSVQVAVSADNDRLANNNVGQLQLGVVSGMDLAVTVTTSANSVYVNDPVDYAVDVKSQGALGSHGGTISINIGGIPIESFNAGTHACAIDQNSNWVLNCQLADIATGTTSRITLRGRPDQARIANGAVNLELANDVNYANNTATIQVVANAEREVRTSVSAEELRAVVGNTYELTYTLNALGRLPSQNVRFALQQPPGGVVESVVTAGVTCVADPDFTNCALGTLNPGDTRTVVVRFHMTLSTTSFMSASTHWSNGAGNDYSNAYTWVYANLTIDVAAAMGNFFPIDEGVTGQAGFTIETKGVNPAQGVTATIELTPPLRLLSVTYDNGPSGWTCAVLTPQRGRCTGSFTGGSSSTDRFAEVLYTFVSDTAVDGQATLTVSATSDGDPTNNVAQLTLPIRPFIDVSINASNATRMLITGETTTVDTTIITGKNPVPGVNVIPWTSDPHLALDSFSVGGVDCSQTQSGSACSLGTLAANSAIPVRAVFRAVSGDGYSYAVIDVSAQQDAVSDNNHIAIPIFTLDRSNVQLSVAQNSATAVNGGTLNFPTITITNGAATSRDITVDIPLPPFVSVSSVMSTSEIVCTGTTSLQCTLEALSPNNNRTIDIALTATATGTFTSNVTMHAFNDSTADNNTQSVVFTVNAPSSGGGGGGVGGGGGGGGSSSGGSKGGGGGRFEWLSLLLLGALLARRELGARNPRRIATRGVGNY